MVPLATVCRYMERNPVRVGACASCLAWSWSGAGQASLPAEHQLELTPLPFARREDWAQWVDRPQTAAEEAALRRCIQEDRPLGTAAWLEGVQKELGWRERLKVRPACEAGKESTMKFGAVPF